MKKLVMILAVLVMMSFRAADTTWSLDKAHAKLGFIVTHLMISDVEGSFKNFEAKITATKDDFSDAIVELTADVNSIDTDNEQRDTHLKTPDYFDAAKYPTLTFKSKTFKKVADKKYDVTGDLTLHGITKTVSLEVTGGGSAIHPYTKKTITGFKVTGKFKRSDFGVGASVPAAMISDEVTLNANAEFEKQ
jgi:polyisoprenoid-binding protein YceI